MGPRTDPIRAGAPEAFFAGNVLGVAVYERLLALSSLGRVEVRTSKSQVAFCRQHGFAYLWKPGQYLGSRGVDVVLSVALGREVHSPRIKQVAHPSAAHWMHHLEIRDVAEIDEEVAAWLREAADRAG